MTQETRKNVSYYDYLKIEQLLQQQEPLSQPEHPDELLFISIHQSHEIWFKLMIHELTRLIDKINNDKIVDGLKTLHRIQTIFDSLLQQISIIDTLSPDEFLGFREVLSPASGFQSHQYRIIEYLLGLKDSRFLAFNKSKPVIYQQMANALSQKSFYDAFLFLLSRRGFDIPSDVLVRNYAEPYLSSEPVTQALKQVYLNRDAHADLYWLCERMIELDCTLQKWRMGHLKLAERTIGAKMGTGGTKGVDYLASILSKRCFPEIWEVRCLL